MKTVRAVVYGIEDEHGVRMSMPELQFLMAAPNAQTTAASALSFYTLLEHLAQLDLDNVDPSVVLSSEYVSVTLQALKIKTEDRWLRELIRAVRHLKSNKPKSLAAILEAHQSSDSDIHEMTHGLLTNADFKQLDDSEMVGLIQEFHSKPSMTALALEEQAKQILSRYEFMGKLKKEWPKEDDKAADPVVAEPNVFEEARNAILRGSFDEHLTKQFTGLKLKVLKLKLMESNCAPSAWVHAAAQDAEARKSDKKADEARAKANTSGVLDLESLDPAMAAKARAEERLSLTKKSAPLSAPPTPAGDVHKEPELKGHTLKIAIPVPGFADGAAIPWKTKSAPKLPTKPSAEATSLLNSCLVDISGGQVYSYSNALLLQEFKSDDDEWKPVSRGFFGSNTLAVLIVHDIRALSFVHEQLRAAHFDYFSESVLLNGTVQYENLPIHVDRIHLVFFVPQPENYAEVVPGQPAFESYLCIIKAAFDRGVPRQWPCATFLRSSDIPSTLIGGVNPESELSVEFLSELFLRCCPSPGIVVSFRPGVGTALHAALRMSDGPGIFLLFDDKSIMRQVKNLLGPQVSAFHDPPELTLYNGGLREARESSSSLTVLKAPTITSPLKKQRQVKKEQDTVMPESSQEDDQQSYVFDAKETPKPKKSDKDKEKSQPKGPSQDKKRKQQEGENEASRPLKKKFKKNDTPSTQQSSKKKPVQKEAASRDSDDMDLEESSPREKSSSE
jgi:hypothetical protein